MSNKQKEEENKTLDLMVKTIRLVAPYIASNYHVNVSINSSENITVDEDVHQFAKWLLERKIA